MFQVTEDWFLWLIGMEADEIEQIRTEIKNMTIRLNELQLMLSFKDYR